jgi:hypothetical protein
VDVDLAAAGLNAEIQSLQDALDEFNFTRGLTSRSACGSVPPMGMSGVEAALQDTTDSHASSRLTG